MISVAANVTTLMVNGGGSVTGNVTLSSGGQLLVGQNMTTLSVGSDLQTSGGGQVKVGGNLGSLMVTGAIQGKGSEDVEVGDDLGQLMVVCGGNGFGLTDVDIDVSDNIQGLDIRNGDTRGHPHFLGTGEWVAPSNPCYRRVGGPIQSPICHF